MGVGRTKDFVTIVNRFPVHYQRIRNIANARFVTTWGVDASGSELIDLSYHQILD